MVFLPVFPNAVNINKDEQIIFEAFMVLKIRDYGLLGFDTV
jgi:hypothetical protein